MISPWPQQSILNKPVCHFGNFHTMEGNSQSFGIHIRLMVVSIHSVFGWISVRLKFFPVCLSTQHLHLNIRMLWKPVSDRNWSYALTFLLKALFLRKVPRDSGGDLWPIYFHSEMGRLSACVEILSLLDPVVMRRKELAGGRIPIRYLVVCVYFSSSVCGLLSHNILKIPFKSQICQQYLYW